MFESKEIDLKLCQLVIENEEIKKANSKLWTPYLDRKLHEYMVIYNFNYYEIANKFHEIIVLPIRYDFTEDEIRRHWSFLYCCRMVGFVPEETYYSNLKNKYKDLKITELKFDNSNQAAASKDNSESISSSDDIYKYELVNEDENAIKKQSKADKLEIVTQQSGIEEENEVSSKATELSINPNSITASDKPNEQQLDHRVDYTSIETSAYSDKASREKNSNHIILEEDLSRIDGFFKKGDLIRNREENDEDDFPIKLEPSVPVSTDDKMEDPFEDGFNSKSFDEFISQDEKLSQEYKKINQYFEFAIKGINHFIPKIVSADNSEVRSNADMSVDEQSSSINARMSNENSKEIKFVVEATNKINKLIEDSVNLILINSYR